MTDIDEIITIANRKLVMVTVNGTRYFYLIKPDGVIKEIKKLKPLTQDDKRLFITKLLSLIKD